MNSAKPDVRKLVSLPPQAAQNLSLVAPRLAAEWLTAHDPPDARLGSGGGLVHLLSSAYLAEQSEEMFEEWLRERKTLAIQGGGQSRRLPAYAALGKPLIPIPVMRWSFGQRLDQTLVELQAEEYQSVLEQAPEGYSVLVASGDIMIRLGELPTSLPEADVLMLGIAAPLEAAVQFGVIALAASGGSEPAFFLQKPPLDELVRLSRTHTLLVDTGVWLLSARGVVAMMKRCGWDASRQAFVGEHVAPYEMYSEMGLCLGAHPVRTDSAMNVLSCAAVELHDGEFYHLGTSRQLIESVQALQNRPRRGTRPPPGGSHPDHIVQNASLFSGLRRNINSTIWVENSTIGPGWRLHHEHVLTGIPDNSWELDVPAGACIDMVPVGDGLTAIRVYGIDDSFSGAADSSSVWLGHPLREWLGARGITFEAAGILPDCDLQHAPLFPVVASESIDPGLIEWMLAASPRTDTPFAAMWLLAERLSSHDLANRADLVALAAQRTVNTGRALSALHANREMSVFHRLDLDAAAALAVATATDLGHDKSGRLSGLSAMRDYAWQFAVARQTPGGGETEIDAAFSSLRTAIIGRVKERPARPVRNVQEDQIVWGRAPIRLDLSGAWTDAAPFCLEQGGAVVNLAVNLNGQPPAQAFLRPCREPHIVVRSIDLGVTQTFTSFEELRTYAQPGSEFALAKAALALAGFLPEFGEGSRFASLRDQLLEFGSGIELTLLAAIPQGSGLGTSSILAATLLSALGELCSLQWDDSEIVYRTLALEQMLTTGGGWQDQVGALYRGAKLCTTAPGIDQDVTVRWLPDYLFTGDFANRRVLLYYTGITRLAKNILTDIVRGMMTHSAHRQSILIETGLNSHAVADSVQKGQWEGLCEGVRRSWDLKQRLDAGTNPPAVQAIQSQVQDWLAAAHLPGAGGGGYLLMFAKDDEACIRIRRELSQNPPNARARFVDIAMSGSGLEVTRS